MLQSYSEDLDLIVKQEVFLTFGLSTKPCVSRVRPYAGTVDDV